MPDAVQTAKHTRSYPTSAPTRRVAGASAPIGLWLAVGQVGGGVRKWPHKVLCRLRVWVVARTGKSLGSRLQLECLPAVTLDITPQSDAMPYLGMRGNEKSADSFGVSTRHPAPRAMRRIPIDIGRHPERAGCRPRLSSQEEP